MYRRQYLGVACGAVFSIGAGCLGDGNGTDSSATTSTTASTAQSSDTEQTTARTTATESTTTTEPTASRATETGSVQSLPSVSFAFEYETVDGDGQVSITHAGGDSLSGSRTAVVVDGTRAFDGGAVTSNYREVTNEWTETVAAEDELTVQGGQENVIDEYQTVEIEWTPEDGENAELVGRSTVVF